MKYEIYSVKDVVSGQFTKLELFNNNDVAKRWYDGLLAESKIAKDLQLYRLGKYDIETGEIIASVEFIQGGAVNE